MVLEAKEVVVTFYDPLCLFSLGGALDLEQRLVLGFNG